MHGPEMLFEKGPSGRTGASEGRSTRDDFEYGSGNKLPSGYVSPGARKEQLRQRSYRRSSKRDTPAPYAELRSASAFSFLDGASQPEDLIARAAELDLPAVALMDRNGVYGAPRFHKAAQEAGLKALVGAEVVVDLLPEAAGASAGRPFDDATTVGTGVGTGAGTGAGRFRREEDPAARPRITLLVGSRRGYRNLCKLITAGARGRPKGEGSVDRGLLEEHAEGLWCLTGGDEGPVARVIERDGTERAQALIERLAATFDGRLGVELQRHRLRAEEHRNRALVDIATRLRLPLIATNGVRYARASDKPLHDIMTSIRTHVPIDQAGTLLAAQRERHYKPSAEIARLFSDLPGALTASWELSQQLDFTLADLGYRFPDYPLPPDETPISYLRHITWNAARARFRPLTARAQAQIEKELAMIETLDLAGYFLIVWDLIRFCQRESIMVQGRGSAANSAVCYALSITAVDPVKMELLFERFLSEERGEWPDIDLDLPSGDQREKVIQYVYRRYGPHGAAMTANVITYRDRSAAREVAKALGYSSEQVDRLSKQLGTWRYDVTRGDPKSLPNELVAAGFDPEDQRIRLFAEMWQRIQNMPRHLGQHSGGMVLAAGRLDEVVPLEPAAMEDRVVVQWDKDDCADLGIIKVDLLGLGMLQALEEAIPIIRAHETTEVDLAHLPPDDPETYRMLRAADTVGVFQVESRAQMASLPRNAPETFYDLVVQVAIIRPGPIVGGMVHPYFERRRGRQPVDYIHPCLEPILERTLGVPLFQEQILRMAMEAAGFTGGEAEELRRAMGFKRSEERMVDIERRLREGMAARGIEGEAQEQIIQSITSFALYGFPESHAASFALIAYASAYLKAHHPTAFLIALLNAWPMGFYHPASLVKDAQRHGVRVLPIDIAFSDWRCKWDTPPEAAGACPERAKRVERARAGRESSRFDDRRPAETPAASVGVAAGACRLGLRYIRGLRQETGKAIERQRPFADVEDLTRRCAPSEEELAVLAEAGALASLGLTRRQALWQISRAAKKAGPLLEPTKGGQVQNGQQASGHGSASDLYLSPFGRSPLPEMSPVEQTLADFAGAGMTVGPHAMEHVREHLDEYGILRAADLIHHPQGARRRTAGSVIVRQRPGTAKGLLFITLEDETGMCQALVTPDLLAEHRRLIVGTPNLVVEGVIQKKDGSVSLRADRFWPLQDLTATPSHDFH